MMDLPHILQYLCFWILQWIKLAGRIELSACVIKLLGTKLQSPRTEVLLSWVEIWPIPLMKLHHWWRENKVRKQWSQVNGKVLWKEYPIGQRDIAETWKIQSPVPAIVRLNKWWGTLLQRLKIRTVCISENKVKGSLRHLHYVEGQSTD